MSASTAIKDHLAKGTKADPKEEAKAIEKLVGARIGLLIKAPFFGNMATRLVLENADEWCATLATDGRRFYYNTAFVNKLSVKELEFGFAHEVLHCCYDHMERGKHLNRMIYNFAADYVINYELVQQRIGEKITTVQILYDPKYAGMCAEEVYELLMQDIDKLDLDELSKKLLDEHLDGEEDDESPPLTEEERKQIRDEIKEAMLNAAQAAGAGNVPAGIARRISEFTEPKMDWRELIQQQVQSVVKTDYSWMRPGRRSWHCDAILPGMMPEPQIDIAVALDLSGSISMEMQRDFLSEIKGIMEAYTNFKITLWCFDTAVHNPQVFTQDNIDEFVEYVPYGGGGTDFMCNWEWMKANDVLPMKFVMFTDMCPFGTFGDPDYCDTLFIGHGSNTVAPFGVTARYDFDKK